MNTSNSPPIIIAGAGPVGLVLALRLGHWGIPCVVLESEADINRDLRASTFHPPTLDMLDVYGITPGLIDQGLVAPTWQVRMHATGEFAQFDLSVLQGETAHPYRLQCEQWRLSELLMAQIKRDLPHVQVLMGHPLVAFSQTEGHVDVSYKTPGGELMKVRGAFLVGADGGRSQVRKQLDLSFDGHTFPETTILATTHFPFHDHLPQLAFINYCWSEGGTFSLLRLKHLWRVSLYPDEGQSLEEATGLDAVRDKLKRIAPGTQDHPVLEVRPYRIHQRVVQQYVVGRVVLVGDAAHLNSPSGGMGMNGGIHDAFNLAEKLRDIWQGAPLDGLLRYERQRRPIAIAHVLEQSGRNRARMQERDMAKRRAALEALQRKADDPAEHKAHLLNTSMITGLRESAAID
jgi:2-polyprenyl-6-methoxyphenol hydroxylase-like FAD-dependent oxidoreductase